jgi:hypothetical protein
MVCVNVVKYALFCKCLFHFVWIILNYAYIQRDWSWKESEGREGGHLVVDWTAGSGKGDIKLHERTRRWGPSFQNYKAKKGYLGLMPTFIHLIIFAAVLKIHLFRNVCHKRGWRGHVPPSPKPPYIHVYGHPRQ